MSNAKNTQTEKAAATETPVKKDGPMVYCGPTVKNTVKQYTVYHDSKAVPDAVNRFLAVSYTHLTLPTNSLV